MHSRVMFIRTSRKPVDGEGMAGMAGIARILGTSCSYI